MKLSVPDVLSILANNIKTTYDMVSNNNDPEDKTMLFILKTYGNGVYVRYGRSKITRTSQGATIDNIIVVGLTDRIYPAIAFNADDVTKRELADAIRKMATLARNRGIV